MRWNRRGITLIEILLGAMVLAVAMTAILGAYLWQATLNEHSRSLSLAIQDANRVLERVRQQNIGCTAPSIIPPIGTNWDAWLADTSAQGGGGRSIPATSTTAERVIVTCLRQGAPTPPANPGDYCGDDDQVGAGEWRVRTDNTDYDPLQVTVAVCWRSRGRILGECTWNGATLTADDTLAVALDTQGVIDSPAMLTTLVTCR